MSNEKMLLIFLTVISGGMSLCLISALLILNGFKLSMREEDKRLSSILGLFLFCLVAIIFNTMIVSVMTVIFSIVFLLLIWYAIPTKK